MAEGLAVGGLALQGFGLLSAYKGEKEAGRAAGAAADFEAMINEQEARFAEYEKDIALKRHKFESEKLVGAQVASMAGQGFTIRSGTNQEILQETTDLIDYDASIIRWMGNVNAWRARVAGQQSRLLGESVRAASDLRATGTLLKGAAGIIGSAGAAYQQFRSPRTYTTQPVPWPTPRQRRLGLG